MSFARCSTLIALQLAACGTPGQPAPLSPERVVLQMDTLSPSKWAARTAKTVAATVHRRDDRSWLYVRVEDNCYVGLHAHASRHADTLRFVVHRGTLTELPEGAGWDCFTDCDFSCWHTFSGSFQAPSGTFLVEVVVNDTIRLSSRMH